MFKRRSNKKRLLELRTGILEQIRYEQELQTTYRMEILESELEDDLDRLRDLYDESVAHVKVLHENLNQLDKSESSKKGVSKDTILVVAGNLAGILLILNFERMDIIRTKAISFVMKGGKL